jgi:hypothetical protein
MKAIGMEDMDKTDLYTNIYRHIHIGDRYGRYG